MSKMQGGNETELSDMQGGKRLDKMCPICLAWQLADQRNGKYICFKCQTFFEYDYEKEIDC